MNIELEAEKAGNQDTLCLDTLTCVTASSGQDLLVHNSFQGHGLLNGWPDAPFQDFDYDISLTESMLNDTAKSKNIESPFLSTFDEWYPACSPNTNEPNDPINITDLSKPFPFPQNFTQNFTGETTSETWLYSMESVSVFGESSASSSSAAQSIETEMTPFPPCSPELSPSIEESLASQRESHPKTTLTKKKSRNRPCDLRREMKKVERPEKCPVVGCKYEGAAERRGLNRHLIARHKDKARSLGLLVDKLKCRYFPSCGKTFSRKDHLRRHLKNKHGGG